MLPYALHNSDITLETEGVIVSGCNLSGANGSGLAGALKRKWPMVYKRYMEVYSKWKREDKDIFSHLGDIDIITIDKSLYVINAFTQKYCGYDGKRYADPDAIDNALEKVFKFCSLYDLPLKTVKIGCDLGGLSWKDEIEPIFLKWIAEYPEVEVHIFELDKNK